MTLAQLDAESPLDYDLLVADWERDQATCPKCGRPRSVCGDPETVWYPQQTMCYAEMALAWVQHRWSQLHGEGSMERFHDGTSTNWGPNRSDALPYAADDGRTLWVSTEDLTPDDDFLRSGQSEGQEQEHEDRGNDDQRD